MLLGCGADGVWPVVRSDQAAVLDRELALAALTGWDQVPARQLHRLVGLASGAGRLDRLITAPGCSTGPIRQSC